MPDKHRQTEVTQDVTLTRETRITHHDNTVKHRPGNRKTQEHRARNAGMITENKITAVRKDRGERLTHNDYTGG